MSSSKPPQSQNPPLPPSISTQPPIRTEELLSTTFKTPRVANQKAQTMNISAIGTTTTNHTRIAPSAIPDAGRGLFLTKDVLAGELIFNVKRPLLAIVDEKILNSTCDECIAYSGPSGSNVLRDDTEKDIELNFLVCKGCEVVWYCSQSCKDKAWQAHHQYECKTYNAIRNDELSTDPRYRSITSKALRGVVRLLALRKHKQISEEDFTQYMELSKGTKQIDDTAAAYIENLRIKHDIFDLPIEKLEHLFLAASNNECQLDTPNLLTTRELEKWGIFTLVEPLGLGICLDPQFSMINHSCLPTVFWTFEGRELQVRAEMDLVAGQELTITYIPRGGFYARMERLNPWGIKCLCALCARGPIEPLGSFRERVDKLLMETNWTEDPETFNEQVIDTILEFKEKGYGWSSFPLKLLYRKLYRSVMSTGDLRGCLMTLVRIRYGIDKAEELRAFLGDVVETGRLMLVIMGVIYRERDTEEEFEDIGVLVAKVYVPLWRDVLMEIEGCYGRESSLARWERKKYEQEIVPLGEPEDKDFQGSLVQLMAWAGMDVLPKTPPPKLVSPKIVISEASP